MTTTLKHTGDEEYLEQAAQAALPGEEVLAAAIFGLQDAVYGQLGGLAVGNRAGQLLDGFGPVGDVASMAVDVAAMREGKKLVAKANDGMTVGLLVAVTPTRIAVLNWDGDAAGEEKASFDRATTEIHITKWGFTKIVTLAPADGTHGLKLAGSTARHIKKSGPDKLVLHLLTDPS